MRDWSHRVFLCVCIVLAGCQTVPTQVSFQSQPPAAEVYVNERFIGSTPVSTAVSCDPSPEVLFRKVGYVEYRLRLPTFTDSAAKTWGGIGFHGERCQPDVLAILAPLTSHR